MQCNCGSKQIQGVRKYFVNTSDFQIPFFVGCVKCPTCLKFNDSNLSDFYLLHTVQIVKTYADKIANAKKM